MEGNDLNHLVEGNQAAPPPPGGLILCPRIKILTYLEEVNSVMLHNKYQGSLPCGFRREDFSHFPYISLCIICDPPGGAISGPRSIISTNLVEVH